MEIATAAIGQVNLLPFQFGAVPLSGAQPEQGAQTCCSPFMAVLQRILLGEGCQAELGETAEIGANETDDGQQKSIEQAILVALTQLLQQNGTTKVKEDEAKPLEEDAPTGDVSNENESLEELLPGILTVLSCLEDATTGQALPVLPPGGNNPAEQENALDAIIAVMAQPQQKHNSPSESTMTASDGEAQAGKADGMKIAPEADDRMAALPDDGPSQEKTAQSSAEVATVLSGIPVPPSNDPTTGIPTEREATVYIESDLNSKKAYYRPEGTTETKSAAGNATCGDRLPTEQILPENEDQGGKIGYGEPRHLRRTSDHATKEQGGNEPLEDMRRGEGIGGRTPQGPTNDLGHHAKVLYSRFQTAGDESQKPFVNSEPGALQGSEGMGSKNATKTQSLLGGVEPEIVKLEGSAKSQSFSKGDGDSNSLGQGMAGQKATEKTAANKPETAPFGDIVADRIARTTEHIAQTNRSDLTLRLKIDGSESVLLEMKERGGKMVIGIQCQDKTLLKALENQKETMVKNLESKNLTASISITSIGEDEQDKQKEQQRGRREQSRDNWNGRQIGSSPYFETLI